MNFDPLTLVRPKRTITGMSAVLLPFDGRGGIDWPGFREHLVRTQAAGLTPTVNMDTGYVNLLDEPTRLRVLDETRDVLGGANFVAGAFVADRPGDPFCLPAYQRQTEAIQTRGGTPIVFQSFGLSALPDEQVASAYGQIARGCARFLAFELAPLFAPFGRIYPLSVYAELLAIPECIGAKHSSLRREPEWERIALRSERRPDFLVLTGNDLAIDMVMYGSDYLLGLATFAPDLFARRDAFWAAGDPAFFELNDLLQYLGCFAFRPPVPAYKHSAAQFLRLRGWIGSDQAHPNSPTRPDSDRAVLADIAERLAAWSAEK
jgi:dihydrodipicolinate synthase/N-acetylneuraminate lyase